MHADNPGKPERSLADTVATSASEVTQQLGGEPIRKLGKYPLTGRIGIGTMGEVWAGKHPTLAIRVAVKILSAEFVRQNPDYQTRFLNEAKLAAQLNHPNMVRIFDGDVIGNESFLVMEFMSGGTLGRRLRADQAALPEAEAIGYILQVGEALAAAHDLRIVHRDIKPDNIMLTSDGQAKLADLGLAKDLGTSSQITAAGTGMGTPLYMSPEQAMDASKVDPRSDIYSLGATLYHLVVGSPPFEGDHMLDVIQRHVKEKAISARQRNPKVSAGLDKVLARMLEKAPENRYQTMREVLADLRRVAAGLEPRLDGSSERGVEQLVLNRKQVVVAATIFGVMTALLVGLLAALGVLILHHQ